MFGGGGDLNVSDNLAKITSEENIVESDKLTGVKGDTADAWDEVINLLEAADLSTNVIIPTRWDELNSILGGGLWRGHMTVVGGRPGAGRSMLSLNIAVDAAKVGVETLVFSPLMSRTELNFRMLADMGRIQVRDLRERRLTDHQWSKLRRY